MQSEKSFSWKPAKPMSRAEYRRSSHCTYLTQYHLIWCPKFRYSVLKGEKVEGLKELLREICARYRYEIRALEVMPDHIHIFISCPQTVAPADAARTLKSISAIEMFRKYPDLKRFYARCGSLWSQGYFIASVGQVSEAAVRKYIEDQKKCAEENSRRDRGTC